VSDEARDNYRAALAATIDPPEAAAGPARLAASVRRLVQVVTGSSAPDAVMEEVAEQVDALVERLEPWSEPSRFPQADRLGGGMRGMFLTHPMIGITNPISPGIVVRPTESGVRGEVVYTSQYEGPPNCVHGGFICAGFDAVLTMVAGSSGRGGLTKSLAVRYRKPTPLNTPLVYEGEVEAREERVTRITGRLLAGDVVCAEATAEVAYRPS